jgi:hypothetical protein
MLRRLLPRTPTPATRLLSHMASTSTSPATSTDTATDAGVTLAALPKSHVFTTQLPADGRFPTPASSFGAGRAALGPRAVARALFTYVRPEEQAGPELLAVGGRALADVGLRAGEAGTAEFARLVAGNRILWDAGTGEGIYPWAQCYGGAFSGAWGGLGGADAV